ncbi:MAG: endonuclease [Burkholderiales bacterium]|nr:endonuclease [Burkholderiales bacterium]
MKLIHLFPLFVIGSVLASPSQIPGNTSIESFTQAKQILRSQVFNTPDSRVTIYCGIPYNRNKIMLPTGFNTNINPKRAERLEWEHVVPAENFGRAFSEWRNGDPSCVDNKGKSFKGRKCADQVNAEFRRMHADLHNLFPIIGSVNALRSNFNFEEMPEVPATFGSCEFKVSGRRAEPPARAKGIVARAYKYMDATYPSYNMGTPQKRLMEAWDKQYPVTEWECQSSKKKELIQGNPNPFVKEKCIEAGLWN